VLAVGLLLVTGGLALDMSGSTSRTAGSDHVSPVSLSASVPGGGVLCQPVPPLPADAARIQLLVATHGRLVPELGMRFDGPGGVQVASGRREAGAREGYVTFPLIQRRRAQPSTSMCLRVGGTSKVLLRGEQTIVGSAAEVIDGTRRPGRITVLYLRSGRESWWQLLPTLSTRFGLGKAPFFGAWTLALIALLVLGVWVAAVRLLLRELT
jgi:hypothetical protein